MKKKTDLAESMLYIYRSLAICALITTAIIGIYNVVMEYERNATATIANHVATMHNATEIQHVRGRVYDIELKLASNGVK